MKTRRTGLVTDEGAPRTVVGAPVAVGDAAPEFSCRVYDPETWALDPFGLADTPAGTVRVFSVVPSLDTPVCALQTTRFDASVAAMGGAVAAFTVSVDTPYAMDRFCRSQGVGSLVSLSDYRPERSFGHAWGVLAEETGELVRAVFVVDRDGRVAYEEIVPEIADQPDYDAALALIRAVT